MYKIDEGYEILLRDDENTILKVKPTYKIQKVSLEQFAKQLGYFCNDDGSFAKSIFSFHSPARYVKLSTMAMLHNTNGLGEFCFDSYDTRVGRTCDKFGFTPEMVKRAVEEKLVKQVYLQYGKKNGMKVQSHVIEFA